MPCFFLLKTDLLILIKNLVYFWNFEAVINNDLSVLII
jgi:hypothetical protein